MRTPANLQDRSTRTDRLTLDLRAFAAGDRRAMDRVLPLVYRELRAAAARQLRGAGAGRTLQPTVLVHEAYLRLLGQRVEWQGRDHFLGVAGCLMRRIIIDQTRARKAAKRGGAEERVTLDEQLLPAADSRDQEILAIDAALTRLETLAPRQARIVELRYFGGLSLEETAAALDLSPATIKREWLVARAFLHRELTPT